MANISNFKINPTPSHQPQRLPRAISAWKSVPRRGAEKDAKKQVAEARA